MIQAKKNIKYSKEQEEICMEVKSENTCTSIFVHSPSEMAEAFTELWTQLINEREDNKNVVLQTNILGL